MPAFRKNRKKLFDEKSRFVYEGLTYRNRPFGAGTVFNPDGTPYLEGVFDVKGLVCGREYGPDYPEYSTCIPKKSVDYNCIMWKEADEYRLCSEDMTENSRKISGEE